MRVDIFNFKTVKIVESYVLRSQHSFLQLQSLRPSCRFAETNPVVHIQLVHILNSNGAMYRTPNSSLSGSRI